MKSVIIKQSELGSNCWLPARFCGGKCWMVLRCHYPEKGTCKAVDTEIEDLKKKRTEKLKRSTEDYDRKIRLLQKSRL